MSIDPAVMMPDDVLRERLDRAQRLSLMTGVAGLVVCAAAWLIFPGAFFHAYLVGYVYWVGIALGCLGLTMLHHLVGGGWGLAIRRPMESAGVTLLPLAILFLPIALGLPHLYEWARPDEVAADDILKAKSAYLNPGFFLGRTCGYFVVWLLLALLIDRLSAAQDKRSDFGPSRTMGGLSGPGLILLFLTGSFAAIDWMMTLEPHWVSSIYGAMVVVGEGLATLASLVLVTVWMSDRRPMSEAVAPGRLHDLGNLMLAFTMLWAYMSFSQFLIIWSGNLPEEIPWYLRRARGAWQWVALALVVFHFFLPFFVLLFRENKRYGRILARVAAWVLAMHWLDLVWLIVPASIEVGHGSSRSEGPSIPWGTVLLSLVSIVGIGGIWLAAFFWRLKAWPMVPLNDANLNVVLEHEHEHAGG
jgi:hypothetical protein